MEYENFQFLRNNSRGYRRDPPVFFHPRILVGSGEFLTPEFTEKNEITHVINCAFEEHSPSWFKTAHPDKYYCLQSEDSEDIIILDWYNEFKLIMKTFLRESKNIFVHCQLGINRSAYLTLAFVCKEMQFPLYRTIFTVLKIRPCIFQNKAYFYQVRDFLYNK
jgi:hypothetical protein